MKDHNLEQGMYHCACAGRAECRCKEEYLKDLLLNLEQSFKRCSDCGLHKDYVFYLNKLPGCELTQELVDFLCEKSTSKKHFWEIRLDHLRILLLNESARKFDLKSFYLECLKRSRRLALKIFYIRGYAIYASEEELTPIMAKFCANLEKNHDYIDYEHILSAAGLPYLAKTYGYDCFIKALHKAEEEYQKIDPLLRGFFTLDENINQVDLLSYEETNKREEAFFVKRGLR